MKYNAIWFDADQTLFDFSATEYQVFSRTLHEFGLGHDITAFYATYRRESDILWALLEEGKISKEFLRDERFRRTLAAHGADGDPEVLGARYLEILPETCVLMDKALEVCGFLAERATLGIITNGFEKVQMRRLEVSGLKNYFDFVVVSEACGYAKPDVRFFEYASELTPNFQKEKVLVVGDRLEADIKGAQNFGVDSCWFNPMKIEKYADVVPTFEISHLSELCEGHFL